MIKFLRHIRLTLMMEKQNNPNSSKTGRYLKYAIGEIILVVIGILIALQINTWRENQKIKKLEIDTLTELKEALVQDTLVLSLNIEDLKLKSEASDELIEHIKNRKPYVQKLDTLMMLVYFHKGYNTFNTAAFELLKERGFGIIQNKELRKRITNHYTTEIDNIRSILSRLNQINMIQGERMYQNYAIINNVVKPFNYEEVLNDEKVFSPFYHFQTMNGGYLRRLDDFKQRTKTILMAIITELDLKRIN